MAIIIGTFIIIKRVVTLSIIWQQAACKVLYFTSAWCIYLWATVIPIEWKFRVLPEPEIEINVPLLPHQKTKTKDGAQKSTYAAH